MAKIPNDCLELTPLNWKQDSNNWILSCWECSKRKTDIILQSFVLLCFVFGREGAEGKEKNIELKRQRNLSHIDFALCVCEIFNNYRQENKTRENTEKYKKFQQNFRNITIPDHYKQIFNSPLFSRNNKKKMFIESI